VLVVWSGLNAFRVDRIGFMNNFAAFFQVRYSDKAVLVRRSQQERQRERKVGDLTFGLCIFYTLVLLSFAFYMPNTCVLLFQPRTATLFNAAIVTAFHMSSTV
jgi:hypothetical protein